MPFPFVYLCDLLDDLERPHLRQVPLLANLLRSHAKDTIVRWLKTHRYKLDDFNTDGGAVISMLRPEMQTERQYQLDSGRLELVIARTLQLSKAQYVELQKWQTEPSRGDLGACVSRIMCNSQVKIVVRAQANAVTCEEIDQALLRIATFNSQSSLELRSLAKTWAHGDEVELLGKLYCRLGAREAKWLTRLVLKNYAPVLIPEDLDLGSKESFLPNCLKVNIRFPSSAPAATRREGTGSIKGTATIALPGSVATTCFAREPDTSTPTLVVQRTNSYPPSSPSFQDPTSTTVSRTMKPNTNLPTPPTSSIPQPPSPNTTIPKSSNALIAKSTLSQTRPALTSLSTNLLDSRHQSQASQCSQGSHQSQNSQLSPHLQPSTASQNNSSQPKVSPRKRKSKSIFIKTGTGRCRLSKPLSQSSSSALHHCPLSNCMFLLSPCISSTPYIKEQLLPWHGCNLIDSFQHLSHASLPHTNIKTRKPYRKVVLVESNRTKETVAFLEKIRDLKLLVKSGEKKGKKDWVEIYDWRLLECVTKQERGRELGYNPWRRCWIGAV